MNEFGGMLLVFGASCVFFYDWLVFYNPKVPEHVDEYKLADEALEA